MICSIADLKQQESISNSDLCEQHIKDCVFLKHKRYKFKHFRIWRHLQTYSKTCKLPSALVGIRTSVNQEVNYLVCCLLPKQQQSSIFCLRQLHTVSVCNEINCVFLQVNYRSRSCDDTCCQWHCRLFLLYQGLHLIKTSSKIQQGQLY